MTEVEVLDILYQAFLLALRLSLPFLLVSMVVGVVISIFQAATQINEQTLTFVPKVVCVFLGLMIFGHWMLNSIVDYMTELWSNFSIYIR